MQLQEILEYDVETLTKIVHPNIVNIIEVGEENQANSKKGVSK